jgi:hypothetical protein
VGLVSVTPGALRPGVRRPKREADHSPPPNTHVKNIRGTFPALPLHAVMPQLLSLLNV